LFPFCSSLQNIPCSLTVGPTFSVAWQHCGLSGTSIPGRVTVLCSAAGPNGLRVSWASSERFKTDGA
jgi:hypothetical protein